MESGTKETLAILKKAAELGIGVIKTLPLSETERMQQFGTKQLEEAVQMLNQTGVSVILIDSRCAENTAECGLMILDELYHQVRQLTQKPLLLVGGITPENVTAIVRNTGADFIDVMFGVEEKPLVKDQNKINKLIKMLYK